MRIAVSGSHSTGKSTLIEAFLAERPHYAHEPEAYELLADEISMTPAEGPDFEGLTALIELTVLVLANYQPGDAVIFERSPVDYLAYAAVTHGMTRAERQDLLDTHLPTVQDAVRQLDLIVLLPVSSRGVAGREGEDEGFRQRVDEALRQALVDDDYDLFSDHGAAVVLELSPSPGEQLAELLRRA